MCLCEYIQDKRSNTLIYTPSLIVCVSVCVSVKSLLKCLVVSVT